MSSLNGTVAEELGPEPEYNLSLQIGGIFIILAASALGVILPLLLYFFGMHNNQTIQTVLLGVKACGVGIIICTGFIHMLGDASEQLSRAENPELPEVFEYECWASALAMLAIFLCALADFICLRLTISKETSCRGSQDSVFTGIASHHHGACHGECEPSRRAEPLTIHSTQDELEKGQAVSSKKGALSKDFEEEETYLSSKWRVVTLESGILIHSVLIGLDMGMQAGPTYDALLIAISFHQFFEGFALSQILIEAKLEKVWILIAAVAFYAITTPAGIAAGVGVHSFYDEGSASAMMTMGILDSLAGGVLIYMGLTNLLSAWIVNSRALALSHWSKPLVAFIGLALGMLSMAVVGKWA